MLDASQNRVNSNFGKICELTNSQPLQFLDNLKKQVKELVPDYPWDDENDTAFTYLWAITESYKGVSKACDDWIHAFETVTIYRPSQLSGFVAVRGNKEGEGKTKMEALTNLYKEEGTWPYGRN